MPGQLWPAPAAWFVCQSLYPALQKPLCPLVDTATGDPDHGGNLDEGQAISQQENDPPPSGTRRMDSRRALPRQQRLAFVCCEGDCECGLPATRHTDP